MGIKETVRKSTDGDFIHANIDIDLIITEANKHDSIEKPDEIFNIIEHFCLGKRRYYLVYYRHAIVYLLIYNYYAKVKCKHEQFVDHICLIVLYVQVG